MRKRISIASKLSIDEVTLLNKNFNEKLHLTVVNQNTREIKTLFKFLKVFYKRYSNI